MDVETLTTEDHSNYTSPSTDTGETSTVRVKAPRNGSGNCVLPTKLFVNGYCSLNLVADVMRLS